MNAYLNGLEKKPPGIDKLADIIQFNIDHADKELISPYYDDQSKYVFTPMNGTRPKLTRRADWLHRKAL